MAVAENKLTVAEKWFKQVVNENPAHFTALRLLINIKIKLKRSAKAIKANIVYLLQFLPYDNEGLKWLNEINALGGLVCDSVRARVCVCVCVLEFHRII